MPASTPDIRVKRIYEPAQADDGARILVDRLWPRGVSKERLQLAFWEKDGAPSTDLRVGVGHDPAGGDVFQLRYIAELQANEDAWRPILDAARSGDVTLIYGARDTEHNEAVVLQHFLQDHLGGAHGS